MGRLVGEDPLTIGLPCKGWYDLSRARLGPSVARVMQEITDTSGQSLEGVEWEVVDGNHHDGRFEALIRIRSKEPIDCVHLALLL
ncbi:hypothetical protein SAMN06265365_14221 [Tistlia consotensis]|uniref:Uncharacterized protein n=1 Tax=Tistlia consotensis USBA 355 TaxID=560819 RepID=A0A1Y6CW47_9PROT|nr:hypothetical protein [Tistlia consotensis]SMF82057.1 hypothetical protein SAMN05428998_14521 [Tistlia consotensis USBA 355]SNS25287.1 hypothetical protein SAMN06265365_14221 [Tistlia consotensis]